jgi:hypothetical protein
MAAETGEHVAITPRGTQQKAVLFDIHDCTFAGPGGLREFAKQVRYELGSLEVLGQ